MYINDIRGLAIIPAKTDSTRLKKKNLRVIAGKTLVEHALDYATESELIRHIVITTESDEVKELTKKYNNIFVFDRDESYMGEREVADVYVNVANEFKRDYENLFLEVTHVVGIQPDHPDRQTNAD